jgi:hypothetical protein
MNEYKRIAMLLLTATTALTAAGCGQPSSSDAENWHYSLEVGFVNHRGDHVAASSLVITGNGSHKGTPGIYVNGKTVMPFVDRGPCNAGSPCWTGTVAVPRDGKHEFVIQAAVKTTPAEWRILAGTENESHSLYCEILREGMPVSLTDDTGVGYSVTPVQTSGEFTATCNAHN